MDISALDFQSKDDQAFTISSLGHPQSYPVNSLISYTFEAPDGSYVVLQVLLLETENRRDVLFVGEGTDVGKKDTILDTFTGDLAKRRTSVESQTRHMWVMFVSDYKNNGAGYQIEISIVTPNIRLSLGESTTFYPTTGTAYTSRQFGGERWGIESPENTVIRIQFIEFDLVTLEVFAVFNGLIHHNLDQYFFEYVGEKLLDDMVSPRNRMTIVFATYSDNLNGTFLINVTAIEIQPDDLVPTHIPAGGTVHVTSPNYPGLYPDSFSSVWVVSAPKGFVIRCRFLDLRFPNDNDGMGIGDGSFYRAVDSGIVSFGGLFTDGGVYNTTTNAIYIQFGSDATNGNGGFKLELSAITLPIVLEASDVHILESPSYPMPYQNNAFIEWNVKVQPGFGVLLRFTNFGLKDDGDVLSVGMGNSSSDTSSITGTFSWQSAPSDFVVWSDRVWIQFTSDSFGIGAGFSIEIRPIQGDGHCLIPLGMESVWISDNSLSATSQRDKTHSPSQARLYGPSSWIPDPEADEPTIQVDFGQAHYITGMIIQGGQESVGTWLESILVTFEDDSKEIIEGKWNPELVSLILLLRPRLSIYIGITPRSKDPHLISLRFEVLGCQSGCHFDLGLASGILPLAQIPLGLNQSEMHLEDLRLLPYEHRPETGWRGRPPSYHDGVEVLLDSSTIVRDVIIQQCYSSRLHSFNLTTISNGSSYTYQFNISDCEYSMCKVSLQTSLRTSQVTIRPTEWNDTLCFRLELLGCHSVECTSPYCEKNCSSAYLSSEVKKEIFVDQTTFPSRAICQQEISLPADQYVVLLFHGFQNAVDISGNLDGALTISDTMGKTELSYDLNEIPSVFVSSSSNLFVTISSGLLTGISNVTTSYGYVDKPGCSNRIEEAIDGNFSCIESSGFVMSPGYFDPYPPDLDLSWAIATKPWTQISLRFVELDVKSLDEGCHQDYVIIIDTSSKNVLGRFCDRIKPSGSVLSSLNRMEIKFHSDSIGSGSGFLSAYETSPLVPDVINITKNYTCPSGWDVYQASCYQLSINPEALTWNEAELICQENHGGHLVSIRDEDEMIFLHYMISSQWEGTETKTYIGLGSRDTYGVFHWNDGTPMSYTDWHRPPRVTEGDRQPNGGSLEACTMLVFDSATSTDLSTNLWHDVACASPETKQFICETSAIGPIGHPVKLILPLPPEGSISNCRTGHFQCSSGECISKVFVCDRSADCLDAHDEENCQEGCTPDQFECSDGSCISISFYCDSISHCLDNSDETECAKPPCTDAEYACTNGQCIPAEKRCDFISHCYDYSDEQQCVLELSPSAFQCYDGSLFPRKVKCDGIIDCIGNTNEDEHSCPYINSEYTCTSDTDIRCNNGVCSSPTSRCIYELDEFGFITGCRDVTHLRECGDFECPVSYLKCPSSYCIPLRYRCNGKQDCPFAEDEAFCDNSECPGGSYRCHGQHYCISIDHVCDDVIHCPEQDDEQFCDDCPRGCQCDGLSYSCYKDVVDLILFPRQLRKLSLTCNEPPVLCNSSFNIVADSSTTVDDITRLIPGRMPSLISLNLEAVRLVEIHHRSFLENSNILNLNLAMNEISSLSRGTFEGLSRMTMLNLSGNPLTTVEVGAFANLSFLRELDLRGSRIAVTHDTDLDLFTGLENLQTLHSDRYVFCCLAGLEDSVGCNAPRDQFSSCEELMANQVLRVFIWLLGGSAFVGNAFVIAYRLFTQRRDHKTIVQSSFITNLAVSDFLMGLYMITIASADIFYRGNYAVHADEWQSSALCKMAGMLSVVSSEASVLFIMMISIDRCIHVMLPFKRGLHLTQRSATCSQLFIWFLAILVSVLPVVIPVYIEGNFYGQSGVCLALPLTVDRPAGWHYSISLFIGANFVAFLVTLLCYGAIYIRYHQSKQMIAKTGRAGAKEDKRLTEDIKLAAKMSLIVGTDLICWFPIIIMGILSAAGKLTISAQVYAWTAVFVLPVNSSLNPYLYTFSSIRDKKRKITRTFTSMTAEHKSMETSLRDEDGSSTAMSTPFTIIPLTVVHRLEPWLKHESRDLTPHELEVIKRDIGQSRALLRKFDVATDECLKNIIVQVNEANTIQQALVLMDLTTPTIHLEKNGSDDTRPMNNNLSKVMTILKDLNTRK